MAPRQDPQHASTPAAVQQCDAADSWQPPKPEKAPKGMYAKAIVVTLLATYPFLAVVESAMTLDSFMPCNDKPCIFTRLVGSEQIPASYGSWVQVRNGEDEVRWLGPYTPAWAEPNSTRRRALNQTGPRVVQESHTSSRDLNAFESALFRYQEVVSGFLPMGMGTLLDRFDAAPFPSAHCRNMSAAEMRTLCSSRETRQGIENSLLGSVSMVVYIVAICLWAASKIVHDCLLLAGKPEEVTLRVGFVSLAFQELAVPAGFLLAVGAIEVFAAPAKGDGSCACFYKLPDIDALLLLAAPITLFYTKNLKLKAVAASVLNGDHLYFRRFDVPFHLVRETRNWSSGTLLAPEVAGSRVGMKRTPERSSEFYTSALSWLRNYQILSLLSNAILTLVSTTLVARVMTLLYATASDPRVSAFLRCSLKPLMAGPAIFALLDNAMRLKAIIRTPLHTVKAKAVMVPMRVVAVVCYYPLVASLWNAPQAEDQPLLQAALWGAAGFIVAVDVLIVGRHGLVQSMGSCDDEVLVATLRSGSVKHFRIGTTLSDPAELESFARLNPRVAAMYLQEEVALAERHRGATDNKPWKDELLCRALLDRERARREEKEAQEQVARAKGRLQALGCPSAEDQQTPLLKGVLLGR